MRSERDPYWQKDSRIRYSLSKRFLPTQVSLATTPGSRRRETLHGISRIGLIEAPRSVLATTSRICGNRKAHSQFLPDSADAPAIHDRNGIAARAPAGGPTPVRRSCAPRCEIRPPLSAYRRLRSSSLASKPFRECEIQPPALLTRVDRGSPRVSGEGTPSVR